MIVRLPLLALAGALAFSPAVAQTVSPGGTGVSGGIPHAVSGAADRTGSITATGQTKPPGAAEGDNLGASAEVDRRSRQIDRQIGKGICKGCD